MLVSRLVVQEDVTNSWASTTVRRRIQVSFYEADCTQWSRDYEEDPGFKEDPVMRMWNKYRSYKKKKKLLRLLPVFVCFVILLKHFDQL